jgi:hypothetical protein
LSAPLNAALKRVISSDLPPPQLFMKDCRK